MSSRSRYAAASVAALLLGVGVPLGASAATTPAADQYGTTPTPTATGTGTVSATVGPVTGTGNVSTNSGAVKARCISRRVVNLTMPSHRFLAGERIASTRLVINGHVYNFGSSYPGLLLLPNGSVEHKGVSGHNRLMLDFRGLLKESVAIDLSLRTNKGSTLLRRSLFHPCLAGTPALHAKQGRYVVIHRGKRSKGILPVSFSLSNGGTGWIALAMAVLAAVAVALIGRRIARRHRAG